MPEDISIAERIERQVALTAAGIVGIGSVYRWDARGITQYASGDCVVTWTGDNASEDAQGSTGYSMFTMGLNVSVVVHPQESGSLATGSEVRRWVGRIHKTLMANPFQLEGTSTTELALDTRIIASGPMTFDDGRVQAAVQLEIDYRTNRDDPAIAPGITAKQE